MKINIRSIIDADEEKLNDNDSIDEALEKLKSHKNEPKPEADGESETEIKTEEKSEPEPEVEADPETEQESEVEADPETEPEPEVEVESEPELQNQSEPELETEPALQPISQPVISLGEKLRPKQGFFKKYGWLFGIAACICVMAVWTFVATNMIPREVNATINGTVYTVETKAYTIGEFLEEQDIKYSEEDYINKPVSTIIYDGINFKITHATPFKVKADGKVRNYKTLSRTVKFALEDCDIKVGKRDIVTPGLDETLKDDMRILIQRVTAKEKTFKEDIPFKTVKKDDTSMNEGETKVVTEGKEGKAKVTYEILYVDGKEHSRTEISREIITAPVDKVVAKGTRINYNGTTYSRKLTVKAYSYTGGGTTAMGTRARVGEIAVDPSVIPLGTNVYIEGIGARRAEDTGGNIKGNTIDIYMNTQSECINWGVRYVTIYIQ